MDPVKANEVPIPRGSASKKRRISDDDGTITSKRLKYESYESSYEDEHLNGHFHDRHSLPHQLGVGPALLQDIAYSAQQALAHGDDEDLVPVDPALQAFASNAYSAAIGVAPMYPAHDDTVISSIEHQPNGDAMMDGIEYAQNGGLHGPSMEPLTPGPPNDHHFVQTNGFAAKPIDYQEPVRRPSSPISPRYTSAISPTNGRHVFDYSPNAEVPPPVTPVAHHHKASRPPNSGHKASKTPRSSRTPKFKDAVKIETGLDMNQIEADMIDPSLGMDQASIELIKQIQQEDYGLRRRSR